MKHNEADPDGISPYAGRWVARLDGRIIAHGGTPEEAARAAQHSRHKERAEISYMPPDSPLRFSPLVDEVRNALPGQEIFLVGGAVRDALLGRISHDLDFVVPEKAIPLARRVAAALRADFYVLDEDFDTARVLVTRSDATAEAASPRSVPDVLDFSSFRQPRTGDRQGAGSIEDDLRGRDFTINSIAYDLRSEALLDPLHGAADLHAKVIRACRPAAMEDDPIRIVRGVRFAAALDLKIDPATRKAMKEAAHLLPRISPERQRDELFKTLEGKRPDAALRALQLLDFFSYSMPEISKLKGVEQSAPHVADVWEHTLSVVQYLDGILDALGTGYDAEKNDDLFAGLLSLRLGRYRERFAEHFAEALNAQRSIRALLFLAALYHDVSKPETMSTDDDGRIRFLGHETAGAQVAADRARVLNLSNDEVERLRTIVANHMRFRLHLIREEGAGELPTRRAIYRFFRDGGEAAVDLVLLGLADLRGARGHLLSQEAWGQALDVARAFLENYWEKPQESVSPSRLLDGNELMAEYQLEPGPIVGKLMEALREAQAAGQITTRDEALDFGRKWLQQLAGRAGPEA